MAVQRLRLATSDWNKHEGATHLALTGMTLEAVTEEFKVLSAAYALLGREFGK